MYTAKKGGEVLQNGARAIRYRDLQTAVTTAFRCAVKACRALCEDYPERHCEGHTGEKPENFYGCRAWVIGNRFGVIDIVNEKTGAVAARITARFYDIEGVRTVRWKRVKNPRGGYWHEVPEDEYFAGVRFSLTTEVIEKGAA